MSDRHWGDREDRSIRKMYDVCADRNVAIRASTYAPIALLGLRRYVVASLTIVNAGV